jgi:hypothetical protein
LMTKMADFSPIQRFWRLLRVHDKSSKMYSSKKNFFSRDTKSSSQIGCKGRSIVFVGLIGVGGGGDIRNLSIKRLNAN